MKAWKWILAGVGALLLLVVVALALFVVTFDPNAYKPRIVELVRQRTGRTLTIDGKIGLTFFPKLGAAIGAATLSEPNSTRTFARVEDARVAVALLPLFSKRVVVDRVTLNGLAVDLVRFRDGRTNFDDLTGQPAPAAGSAQQPAGLPLALDVAGIAIEHASLGWRDERAGASVRLSQLQLKTGRIASGIPGKLELAALVNATQPKANLQVDLATGYRIDFATHALALSSLALKATGDAGGFSGLDARVTGDAVDVDPGAQRVTLSGADVTAKSKDGLEARVTIPRLQLTPGGTAGEAIAADVRFATAARTVAAKLQLSPFSARGQQVQLARLGLALTAKQGDLSAQGTLSTPVTLDLVRQQVRLPGIEAEVTLSGPAVPNSALKAAISGTARADWGAQGAGADLAVKLDESTVQAKLDVTRWAQPVISFDVTADRLNVDRYLAAGKPGTAPASGGTAPERPFDLSALQGVNATGRVKIGALQVANIKAEQVSLSLKAAGGRVDVDPLAALLYQGALKGSASMRASDDRFTLAQQLSGVHIGPLLRDAAGKDLLEGRGNVTLNVTATGKTVTALKKALHGTASIALRDGAIKGVDIAGTLRKARALLGSQTALEEQAQGGARTDFSELTASFTIKNGVAHNDDLEVKSPLLRLTGRGDIDLGESAMDYTAKASVVATATGQGGKELGQVAGVTVPVRAVGPLASPKYRIDLAALAAEIGRSTVQRELERRLGGKLGGEPGSAGSAVGDALRGLFGPRK